MNDLSSESASTSSGESSVTKLHLQPPSLNQDPSHSINQNPLPTLNQNPSPKVTNSSNSGYKPPPSLNSTPKPAYQYSGSGSGSGSGSDSGSGSGSGPTSKPAPSQPPTANPSPIKSPEKTTLPPHTDAGEDKGTAAFLQRHWIAVAVAFVLLLSLGGAATFVAAGGYSAFFT